MRFQYSCFLASFFFGLDVVAWFHWFVEFMIVVGVLSQL